MYLNDSLKLSRTSDFQPPQHFSGQPPLPLNFENRGDRARVVEASRVGRRHDL